MDHFGLIFERPASPFGRSKRNTPRFVGGRLASWFGTRPVLFAAPVVFLVSALILPKNAEDRTISDASEHAIPIQPRTVRDEESQPA